MRIKQIIKILFFLVFSKLTFAQGPTDIIETSNYIYNLTTPKGWQYDHSISGLNSVYFPKKSSWYESPTVMYVNVIPTDEEKQDNIFSMIDYDLENYMISSPQMKVEYGEKLDFKNGEFVSVVLYLYGMQGNSGSSNLAIAYIPQFQETVNVVMNAEDLESFEANLPAFKSLVKSFEIVQSRFAASAVQSNKKRKD